MFYVGTVYSRRLAPCDVSHIYHVFILNSAQNNLIGDVMCLRVRMGRITKNVDGCGHILGLTARNGRTGLQHPSTLRAGSLGLNNFEHVAYTPYRLT